jgi:glycosyltransferase involved in cell wall biosynthesis
MRIDIIIPTYRKLDILQNLITEIEYNTPENHRLICTCQPLSAAKNRNYGLSFANSEIIVMCDDDIIRFYSGWLTNLIYPMLKDKNIIMCSARLLDKNKNRCNNMGMVGGNDNYQEIQSAINHNNIQYKRVTTACITFRKNDVRFDEKFQGSGYEDTDWMNSICESFNGMKFIVNNQCELIHKNERKGQENKEIWQHNHELYCQKYPWDEVAKNQQWWGEK